jgi:hypothetical protein
MHNLACALLFWIALASPILAQTAQIGDPAILSPRPGDVLQGVVTITGSDDVAGFVSAEVAFTYAGDPTGTWFLIGVSDQPVSSNKITTWDTTVITDGNYVLRLRVILADGSIREITLSGLRVRNYTPIETPTPTATAIIIEATPTEITPEATTIPTITLTPLPFPTPTMLPTNPAALAPMDIPTSISYGGLAVIISFLLFGLYLWLRRK